MTSPTTPAVPQTTTIYLVNNPSDVIPDWPIEILSVTKETDKSYSIAADSKHGAYRLEKPPGKARVAKTYEEAVQLYIQWSLDVMAQHQREFAEALKAIGTSEADYIAAYNAE